MATPIWAPGTLYSPGALVRPRAAPPVDTGQPENPGFETGDLTDWTYSTTGGVATLSVQSTRVFQGSYAAHWPGGPGTGPEGGIECVLVNDERAPVNPGQSISGHCYIMYNPSGQQPGSQGRSIIAWFDAGGNHIGTTQGDTIVGRGNNGKWRVSNVTGIAPAGAASASIGAWMTARFGDVYADAFSWNYAFAGPPPGLIYKAVQANTGTSAASEPTWPIVLGQTVVDNDVTWEAVATSRVVWEAHPILVSGTNEPNWPQEPGAAVVDNSIVWEAMSRRIEDTKAPKSTVVAIASSKVFAGDEDIVPFSATVNPLDWSTRDDAGYLPFGLNTYGANPVTAMGLYRGNLVVFNSAAFQMWQVDEDPASMALLDAVPVSCTYPRSVQAVANDLIFLNAVGVRNIGIAGASTNLQAGNFGEVVDALITPKIRAGVYDPIGLYVPARGQYWIIFGPEAFVLTINSTKRMSWSRYEFPEAITDWTLHGNALYLRTNTGKVWEVTDDAWEDDQAIQRFGDIDIMAARSGGTNIVGYWRIGPVGTWTGDPYPFGPIGTYQGFGNAPNSRLTVTETSPGSGIAARLNFDVGVNGVAAALDYMEVEDGAGRVWRLDYADGTSLGPTSRTWADHPPFSTGEFAMWEEGGTYRVRFARAGDVSFGTPFEGVMQWPFLDFGYMGSDKSLEGFDVSANAENGVDVSVCYDQRNFASRTPDYNVPGDTVPGFIVPLPVTGPSLALRLTFPGGARWEWFSANMYLQDRRTGR